MKPLSASSRGLKECELVFYDALTKNESDEVLKKLVFALTEKLRGSTTVDWQMRDTVRIRLRNLVRITLRRHEYPPRGQTAPLP